ncbi:MAG: response regulator [Ferruginibacter sp.]
MRQKLRCIMLVDDDRLTNFLNNIIIDKAGISEHVERCHSVMSALNYLSSVLNKEVNCPLPDLIFLDMQIPEKSGWKFIEHYRLIKSDFEKQPIIIMLSSVADSNDVLMASHLEEVAAFYIKPLTPKILNTILKNYNTQISGRAKN